MSELSNLQCHSWVHRSCPSNHFCRHTSIPLVCTPLYFGISRHSLVCHRKCSRTPSSPHTQNECCYNGEATHLTCPNSVVILRDTVKRKQNIKVVLLERLVVLLHSGKLWPIMTNGHNPQLTTCSCAHLKFPGIMPTGGNYQHPKYLHRSKFSELNVMLGMVSYQM